MKNISFYTLGCKVNQYETNAMMQKFQEAGYKIVDLNDNISDVCVINTCTVTNMSDRKSRHMLRKIKEKNHNAIIIATGCYAQVAKKQLGEMPEVDIIIGNDEKNDIVHFLEEYMKNQQKIVEVQDINLQKEFVDMGQITYTEKTRAVIKVQDGCNQFCSYCLIPYARGRVRSRKPESILKEIEQISKKGIKEVVITGIHIASYGKDFKYENENENEKKITKYELIDLLEDINKIEGIVRIRLGSLEPTIITEDFIQRLIRLEKICHHFHLSLQSGCDATLKRMNRKYTTKQFKEIVNRLRKYYNDVMLTTDIIVGFPGETEQEFKQTYQFLKEIKFYKMHVFPYSPREGTRAAKMENQIDNKIKESRSKELIEMSNNNQKHYNEQYVGKEVEVLFEEKEIEIRGENEINYYKGHTQNYILVKCKVKSNENLENKFKKVKILKASIEYVEG